MVSLWRSVNSLLGRNGMIGLGMGATAGVGLIAFIIYKEVNRRRSQSMLIKASTPARSCTDGPALFLEPVDDQAAAEVLAQQQALLEVEAVVQGLSPGQQVEMRRRLDDVLTCVASLRSEVAELRGGLQDIAVQIIQDVKKGVEDSQRARRRRHVTHRERTDSMSSSSIYFTASQGTASLYAGDTSEGGYSTAYAESDYTDRDTDRETDKEGEREPEPESEDEDKSCATVLTLRQEDSQEEMEDEEDRGQPEEEEEEKEEEVVDLVVEVPNGELALLLAQSDILHTGDASLKAEGFRLLLANKAQYGDSREFLWRLARAYSDMCEHTKDEQEKRSYAEQGREEAEIALRKNGLNAECHKWFAVLTGLTSQFESMHGKLKNSHLLKEHLDRAIALREDDPLCFYLLGRWCYEVSTLDWLEKKAAAALYETPPTSTLQDALQNFLKAEELNPGFSKTVRLYIAKCHKELGNILEATKWTKMAVKMTNPSNEEDQSAELEQELTALIDKAADRPFSGGDQKVKAAF